MLFDLCNRLQTFSNIYSQFPRKIASVWWPFQMMPTSSHSDTMSLSRLATRMLSLLKLVLDSRCDVSRQTYIQRSIALSNIIHRSIRNQTRYSRPYRRRFRMASYSLHQNCTQESPALEMLLSRWDWMVSVPTRRQHTLSSFHLFTMSIILASLMSAIAIPEEKNRVFILIRNYKKLWRS